MTYPIDLARWDSQFFGFSVGNIELPSDYDHEKLEETLQKAQTKFRLMYLNVHGEPPDTLSLLGNECPCYVRRLFLKKEVPKSVEALDPRIKAYTSTFCLPALERLAIQSGTMSHFRQDPELAPHYEQLFLTWINFAVTKDLADSIWTWYEEGQHLGLVTIRSAKQEDSTTGPTIKEGRIGMLAVETEHRRRGIGRHLIQACDFWCSSLNIPVNAIIVQKDNVPAIALSQTLGFLQDREISVYHYWSPGWIYDARRGWVAAATA